MADEALDDDLDDETDAGPEDQDDSPLAKEEEEKEKKEEEEEEGEKKKRTPPMTIIGKAFVLLNLMLALVFLAFAVSAHVEHDDDFPIRQYDRVLFNPKNAIPVEFEPDNYLYVVPIEDVVAVFRKS